MSSAPDETPRALLDVSALKAAGIKAGSILSASDLHPVVEDQVMIPVRRAGDAISLIAIETVDGRRFLPAFSSAQSLAAWSIGEAEALVPASTSLRDALGAALGGRFDGLVLDAGGAHLVVPASVFEVIRGEGTIRSGETVAFGAPAKVDARLLHALKVVGAEMVDVRSLTLAAIVRGQGAPELVVVAEHRGPDDRLLGKIAQALRGSIGAEPEIGVIDAKTGLGTSIRADLAPVFERT